MMLMRPLYFCICSTLMLSIAGCGVHEIQERKNVMESLLATNAPLNAVESKLGVHFEIYRRGSAEWTRTLTNYSAHAIPRYQRIVAKLGKSEATGHTSTMSMQTWIFLDKKDRLINYEVS